MKSKDDNGQTYIKDIIEKIVTSSDESLITTQYDKLSMMIISRKSALIFNTILEFDMTAQQKKLVLDRIIKQDLEEASRYPGQYPVFYDYIVSRILELNTKAGSEEARGQDKLSQLIEIAKSSKPSTDSPTPLELLMIKAEKQFKQDTINHDPGKGRSTVHNITKFDGQEQALAVQNYVKLETDPQRQERFAIKQLNKYVENLNVTNLNDAEKQRISKAFTAIMKPICNDKEKISLRNSVDKLVRECAQYAEEKMSFRQAWKAYIVEPIKRLLGRENVLKSFKKGSKTTVKKIKKENVLNSFERESVEIAEKIKDKLYPDRTDKIEHRQQVKTDNEQTHANKSSVSTKDGNTVQTYAPESLVQPRITKAKRHETSWASKIVRRIQSTISSMSK